MKVYLDANIIYDLLLNLSSSRKFLDIDLFETRGHKRSKYLYNLIYTKDELLDYVEFEKLIKDNKIEILTSKYAEFEAFSATYKANFVSSLIWRPNFPLPYVLSKVMPKSAFRSILKRHIKNYKKGEEMADWCIEFPSKGVGFTQISDIYKFMNYVKNESIDFSKKEYHDMISEFCRFNMLSSDISHILICKQNDINYLLTKDRDFHDLKDIIKDKTGIMILKGLRETINLSKKD